MFPDTKSQQAVLFRDRQCVMNPAHPDVTRVEPGVNHDVSVSLSGESDYHNDPLMTTPASAHHCVVTRDHPRITDTAQANFRSDDDDEARATNPGIITLISASWRWINYR